MIGTGYVGLTTGVGFASLGHTVACVDINEKKIAQLDMGEVPFYEPGVQERLKDLQTEGKIVFTTNLKDVIGGAEVIMLAVGTPAKSTGEANLTALFKAAEDVGSLLDHQAVIVTKSTVPVGINRRVLNKIRETMVAHERAELAETIQIVSVPEFLAEGSAMDDFLNPDRIVIGADDGIAAHLVDQLHNGLEAPRVLTSIESAELLKYAANALLATKISFINEIANIADRVGADVRDVAQGIGLDPRIGPHFLKAGIGFGGSCFPKDVSALIDFSGREGYQLRILPSVVDVNQRQNEIFFIRIKDTVGPLKGRRVGVWGLSFKPNTDDIRESAALEVVKRLVADGAEVCVYDPEGMENTKQVLPDHVEYAPTAMDAAAGADVLVVLTEWPEFKEVSVSTLRNSMVGSHIFDGRNHLADLNLESHGFVYHGVGLGGYET